MSAYDDEKIIDLSEELAQLKSEFAAYVVKMYNLRQELTDPEDFLPRDTDVRLLVIDYQNKFEQELAVAREAFEKKFKADYLKGAEDLKAYLQKSRLRSRENSSETD